MATAERLRLDAVRVATSGADQRFVAMVRDLLLERAAAERADAEGGETLARAAVGGWPACWDRCAAHCCPNPRGPLPALGQLPPGQLPPARPGAGDHPSGVTA
jgi:ferrochelatase